MNSALLQDRVGTDPGPAASPKLGEIRAVGACLASASMITASTFLVDAGINAADVTPL